MELVRNLRTHHRGATHRLSRLTRVVAAGAVAGSLLVLTPAPASAAVGVDQLLEPAGESTFGNCPFCVVGQTFTPAATTITSVSVALTPRDGGTRTGEVQVTIRAGGPDGAILASVSETRSISAAAADDPAVWQHFDLTEAIDITPGDTYYLGVQTPNSIAMPLSTTEDLDRYAGGAKYVFGSVQGGDLYFRTYGELAPATTDEDGDGVDDADDRCAGTDLGAATPAKWSKNRFWNDADGTFVDGQGRTSGFTLADTGGCDGHQIVEAAGLGDGHAKQGLSRGQLMNWVAQHMV